MNFLATQIIQSSGYNFVKDSNLFNFLISILQEVDEYSQKTILDLIKLHLGLTTYSSFKSYAYKKIPKSNLIKLLD